MPLTSIANSKYITGSIPIQMARLIPDVREITWQNITLQHAQVTKKSNTIGPIMPNPA
jgi:hypothetical protein